MINIAIQTNDFDQQALYGALRSHDSNTGAIVTFTGLVREFDGSSAMHLEHYPGMTEKVLHTITEQACERWPLQAVTVIHRVGELKPSDQIVFVGVASAHRQAAFEANHFIIDILKTRAPFWKKEGHTWVEAKDTDTQAAQKWLDETLQRNTG